MSKSLEDYLKSTESIKGATGSSASILNIPDFFRHLKVKGVIFR
ncbi:MAG: hypothetical protein R3B55_01080 [Candidatus Paceibacterota bacterium]